MSFKATERFRVSMVEGDGSPSRVTVQLSLEGLKLLNADGSRTMRSYNLRNVSSWDLMETSTVIWTRSDVDLEERALELRGDERTIRNLVDTLASCCMQLAELIQNQEEESKRLGELASGGGKTKRAQKLPSVDSVEYWRAPDKAGWLQAQSDVMKMWRRRWFVLKQGFLFRFLSADVSESVKPRGVVDLSKVQDVRDGRAVTGKANTLQLKTASGGSVCYVCESETEMVEWLSALEGAITKIAKAVAGVEDSASGSGERRSSSSRRSGRDRQGGGSGSAASDWAKQVERSLSQGTARRGSGMVSVVDYGGAGCGRASAPTAGYDDLGGISSYAQVSGAAGVAGVSGAAAALDDLSLNYGGWQAPAGGGGYGQQQQQAAPAYSSSAPAYGYGASLAAAAGSYGQPAGPPPGGAGGWGGAPPSSSAAGYGQPAAYAPEPQQQAYGYGPAPGGYEQQHPAVASYEQAGGYGQQQQANGYAAAAGAVDPYQQQQGGYGQPQQQQPGAGYGQQAPAGDAYAGYGQQQQQQQPAVSLIDQVPAQQPAYPYYQHPMGGQAAQESVPAQAPAAPAMAAAQAPAGGGGAASGWQVHTTAEGRPYYFHAASGTTQWEAPPGM